jgi:hypothetical protein
MEQTEAAQKTVLSNSKLPVMRYICFAVVFFAITLYSCHKSNNGKSAVDEIVKGRRWSGSHSKSLASPLFGSTNPGGRDAYYYEVADTVFTLRKINSNLISLDVCPFPLK